VVIFELLGIYNGVTAQSYFEVLENV